MNKPLNVSTSYNQGRGNPVNSGLFSARWFSTYISKNLPTAYLKDYLLSIRTLFCFVLTQK